jgi:perosamine synthetase
MKNDLASKIVDALRTVLPPDKGFIPLHEPTFAGNEIKYTEECIKTGWVSSAGKYVDLFEEKLADFTGAKRAIAVSNGTAALHVCLLLAGVVPGDEVLCPALTFIATANAISYCSATPHFIDSGYDTLGVDPAKLKDYLKHISEIKQSECYNRITGKRIGALVVMHTFGHSVDLEPIIDICKEYKIKLIEDAAESLGSKYKGVHTGNFGIISSLSFNGNKTITTGGGGAVITNDESLGKLAKHITTTAKRAHKWEFYHDMVGYNYRMPNLNAALGVAQMEILPGLLDKKKIVAGRYQKAFSELPGAEFFLQPEFSDSNYWLNVILLSKGNARERDNVLEATNSAGFMTRPAWMLMSKLPMYNNCPHDDLTVAEDLESRIINIPSSPNLADLNKFPLAGSY